MFFGIPQWLYAQFDSAGGNKIKLKEMESLKEKAIKSNGGDRMCEHCVSHAENICKICGEAYVRGFVKGYKQKQKEDRV